MATVMALMAMDTAMAKGPLRLRSWIQHGGYGYHGKRSAEAMHTYGYSCYSHGYSHGYRFSGQI